VSYAIVLEGFEYISGATLDAI